MRHICDIFEKSILSIIFCFFRYLEDKLKHGHLLNEARLKVPCNICRQEDTNQLYGPVDNYAIVPTINEDKETFRVCKLCHVTLCQKCQTQPCEALLRKYLFENKNEFF